jgi:hypothetical protein
LSLDCLDNFMKRQIVLKKLLVAGICILPLAWGAPSAADEYGRGQFLGLDLSTAVLSPKPLGPSAEFVPDPVEANVDHGGADRGSEDRRAAAPTHPEIRVAQLRSEAPTRSGRRHAVAHVRIARHHGNPLDAQASDQRIRAWPCMSGGICDWKRGQRD